MKSAWDCIYVPAVRHFDEVEVNFAALGGHRLMCSDTLSHCTVGICGETFLGRLCNYGEKCVI